MGGSFRMMTKMSPIFETAIECSPAAKMVATPMTISVVSSVLFAVIARQLDALIEVYSIDLCFSPITA